MSGFTKGPWAEKNGIIHSGGENIAFTCTLFNRVSEERLDGESWLTMRNRTEPERDAVKKEEIANGRLIEAAPVMFEILAAIDKYNFLNPKSEMLKIEMEDALAKVRGES